MGTQLFTIGYEGRDLQAFLDCLGRNEIECVVDVREVALSRKKGFSKTILSQALNARGIKYTHMKDLGSPRHLREELKSSGDYGSFFKEMDKHLATQEKVIDLAYDLARCARTCLMCYEREAAICHRYAVARKIKQRDCEGMTLKHL